MTPSPPVNYCVSQFQLVNEKFLQLVALATAQGRRQLVLRAARYMIEELAYDPVHFGESRGLLPHMELSLRIAFAPPLVRRVRHPRNIETGIHSRVWDVRLIARFVCS